MGWASKSVLPYTFTSLRWLLSDYFGAQKTTFSENIIFLDKKKSSQTWKSRFFGTKICKKRSFLLPPGCYWTYKMGSWWQSQILLVEEKTSFPFILINPASGFEKPDKQLSSVLLPLPDGPNMAVLVELVLKLQDRVNPE